MDKDIREFLDRATQKRLYEEKGNVKTNVLQNKQTFRKGRLAETQFKVV